MKRFISHIIIYICSLYVLSWGAVYAIEYYFLNYDKSSKSLWAATIKDQKAEVLLLGSSRIANMMDSKLLSELIGKSTLNLGISGSGYAESFLIFEEYLKKNKKPQYVILNIDEMCLSMNCFKYAQGFKHFELFPLFYQSDVNKIYKQVSTTQRYYSWYAIPILPYIEFNERLYCYGVFQNIAGKNKGYSFDTLTGDKLLENNKFSDTSSSHARILEIDKLSEFYFNQIIDLCKSKNIIIVLVVAPMYDNGVNEKLDVYINQLRLKKDLTCFDFSSDTNFKSQALFYDKIHTNANGSTLYTRLLGERINEWNSETRK